MTQLTGRANTYFYDGGWNDWQLEGSLPVDENKDKGVKPDAKNDFKKNKKKKKLIHIF